jgi:RNase P subunit RPR2
MSLKYTKDTSVYCNQCKDNMRHSIFIQKENIVVMCQSCSNVLEYSPSKLELIESFVVQATKQK